MSFCNKFTQVHIYKKKSKCHEKHGNYPAILFYRECDKSEVDLLNQNRNPLY